MTTVKMVWLRLETAFMLVERTVRFSLPDTRSRAHASASSTTKDDKLDSRDLIPPFEIESLSDLDRYGGWGWCGVGRCGVVWAGGSDLVRVRTSGGVAEARARSGNILPPPHPTSVESRSRIASL